MNEEHCTKDASEAIGAIQRPRFGIYFKLLSVVMLAALMPAVLIATASYWTARDILIEKSHAELSVRRDVALGIVDAWAAERTAEGANYAPADLVIHGLLLPRGANQDELGLIAAYLRGVQEREPLYTDFVVYGAESSVVASISENPTPLAQSKGSSTLRLQRSDEGVMAVVQQEILGQDEGRIGTLVASRITSDLWRDLGASFSTTWGRLSVYDLDGRVLYPRSGEDFDMSILAGRATQQGVITLVDGDESAVIGAYSVDSGLGIAVLLEVDEAQALLTVHELRDRILWIGGVGAVVVSLIGFLLGASLLRPVQALIDGAEAVAGGDLDRVIAIGSKDEIGYLTQVFNQMTESLRRSHTRLQRISITDDLTGLSNRRELNRLLSEAIDRSAERGDSLVVVMMDIDRFKTINDSKGHAVGDVVLRETAVILGEEIGKEQIVARYGGEEFVAVLVGQSQESAEVVVEALRERIESSAIAGHSPGQITASFGLACFPEDGDSEESVLGAADVAMYEAKRQGRNRLVVYDRKQAAAN